MTVGGWRWWRRLGVAWAGRLLVLGLGWLLGYGGWAYGWLALPAAYLALRAETGRADELRRLAAQATALSQEEDLVSRRIDSLPSWVVFPDYQRAEWLNEIVFKIWPDFSVSETSKNAVKKFLTKRVNKFQQKVPGIGQDVRFDVVDLGKIPPKINGVKVYKKCTLRNEIMLDLDIMYAGDCNISFYMGNFKAGIKDIQIRGMLRLILKPLVSIKPFVGGVQLFFFNCPIIDFNLIGLADVLNLPGVNKTIRKKIHRKFMKKFVLPNKYTKIFVKKVPVENLKTPQPEGVLRIHVIQAKDLMEKDFSLLGKGKSDPYVVITIGAQEFKTKTIKNTLNPKWDYWCEALIDSVAEQEVKFDVWDEDPNISGIQKDDFLGSTIISVGDVQKNKCLNTWLTLESAKHGMINLRLTWYQLSSNSADLEAVLFESQNLRILHMSTAILILYIDSANNLPCSEENEQPDTFLKVSVGNTVKKINKTLECCNPIWEQGLTLFVLNPEIEKLRIEIYDANTSKIIGTFSYPLFTLLKANNMQTKLQPYDLESNTSDAEIILSMALRILKNEKTENNHEVYRTRNFKKLDSDESTDSSDTFVEEIIQRLISSTMSKRLIDSEIDANETVHSSFCTTPERTQNSSNSGSLVRKAKLGRLQLTIKYIEPRQRLIVIVHKIANLPLPDNDLSNIPDPYVKLCLHPDKYKETKRKTAVIKDNCNPIFDEVFEYIVSHIELKTLVLKAKVCSKKSRLLKSRKFIGQLLIKLSDLDLSEPVTNWYTLEP